MSLDLKEKISSLDKIAKGLREVEKKKKTRMISVMEYLLKLYRWLLGLRLDQKGEIIKGPEWFTINKAAYREAEASLVELLQNQEKHYFALEKHCFEPYILPYYEFNAEQNRYLLKEGVREKMLATFADQYSLDVRVIPEKDKVLITNYLWCITNAFFLPEEQDNQTI